MFVKSAVNEGSLYQGSVQIIHFIVINLARLKKNVCYMEDFVKYRSRFIKLRFLCTLKVTP